MFTVAIPSIYHKPMYPPVARDPSECPFCHAPGFKAPRCKACGVYGYASEQPPGLQLGRVWRRKGRDYIPDAEADHGSMDDSQEIDLELSLTDLDLIDLEPDNDSGLHYDAEVYN